MFDGSRTAPRSGYLSSAYARSVLRPGESLVELADSGATALTSPIPDSPARDASGLYPMLCCKDWTALADDLAGLTGLVAFVAVLDPLADPDRLMLRRAFPDLLRPFKRHYLVDLARPAAERTHPHHRRNARRAARNLSIDVVDAAAAEDEWVGLYSGLVRKHAITGRAAFPEDSLRGQLRVPGCLVVRASRAGVAHAMSVWYRQGRAAYYHLGASDEAGYADRASFGMFALALDLLAQDGVRTVDLGGAAGPQDVDDGLTRFKQGWSSSSRPALLAGRVLDRAAYDRLSGRASGSEWFPPYRAVDPA